MRHDHRLPAFHDVTDERLDPLRVGDIQDPRGEIAKRALLRSVHVAPRDVPELAIVGRDEHVAIVAEARQRRMDRAIERLFVVKRRRERDAHFGKKRQTIPSRDRFVVRDPLPFDELGLLPLDPSAVRDVARDLRRADDRPRAVRNRRHPDGHLDIATVLAPPQRFERLNPLA